MKKLFLFLMMALSVSLMNAQNYDLVVATDGSGDFDNIQDAINAIRDYKPEGRQRILVKKGVYEEKVIVPAYKTNISLIGEDRDSTILVWHDHANMRTKSGWPAFNLSDERNAQAGMNNKNHRKIGTFQSFTLRVDGLGFECENMTISNDAMTHWNRTWSNDRSNHNGVGQAVAVHVEGDRTVFRNCRLLGFQDTLFTGNDDSRQVYYNCYIEGTVDFIFGPATCWFEECELHALSNGYLTAASTPGNHPYGYVFYRCRVTADPSVTSEWLGRPWRNYASVVFRECELPAVINPKGWHNWNDPAREKTARYYEIKNYGPGAALDARVPWMRKMQPVESNQLKFGRVLSRPSNKWDANFRPAELQSLALAFCDERLGEGTPYVAGTLEPNPLPKNPEDYVEPLVMKFNGVDCTTFVEYMSAAMLGRVYTPTDPTDSIMKRFVTALRYRNGVRGNYATRKHYFSEWIADNEAQGLLTEVTSSIPGAKKQKKTINYMTSNRAQYPQLAASDSLTRAIRRVEERLSAQTTWYIPKSQIHKVYKYMHEGDIVVFVSNAKGLDVFHCGFIWWPDPEYNEPQLLHASSSEHRVTVGRFSLADYAQAIPTCQGIRILRLNAQ